MLINIIDLVSAILFLYFPCSISEYHIFVIDIIPARYQMSKCENKNASNWVNFEDENCSDVLDTASPCMLLMGFDPLLIFWSWHCQIWNILNILESIWFWKGVIGVRQSCTPPPLFCSNFHEFTCRFWLNVDILFLLFAV